MVTFLLVANIALWSINALVKSRAIFRRTHVSITKRKKEVNAIQYIRMFSNILNSWNFSVNGHGLLLRTYRCLLPFSIDFIQQFAYSKYGKQRTKYGMQHVARINHRN